MEVLEFAADDIDNRLSESPEYVEALPFGAILLDRAANILKYNKSEGMIVGRDPDDVIGKNFFNDVAPCAKGRELYGQYQKAVAEPACNVLLDFTFDYKMEPTNVRIHLKSNDTNQGVWMFVKRV